MAQMSRVLCMIPSHAKKKLCDKRGALPPFVGRFTCEVLICIEVLCKAETQHLSEA